MAWHLAQPFASKILLPGTGGSLSDDPAAGCAGGMELVVGAAADGVRFFDETLFVGPDGAGATAVAGDELARAQPPKESNPIRLRLTVAETDGRLFAEFTPAPQLESHAILSLVPAQASYKELPVTPVAGPREAVDASPSETRFVTLTECLDCSL